MRLILPVFCALLAGPQIAYAQDKTQDKSQEIRLEEVAAADRIAPGDLKPKTVVFSDHKTDPLIDTGTGLMKFSDWANAKPAQKQVLSLYPGYEEPLWKLSSGKTKKMRLHMYVAETRFIVSRSPDAIVLQRYATLAFLERVDPAIKSQALAQSDAIPNKETGPVSSKRPDRPWCDGKSVCIRSRYKLEGKLPIGIMLLNKIRDNDKKIADYIDFQSEMRVLEPAEIDEAAMMKLTNVDTPVTGVLEQSVFHVNQIMQFGKFVAVFQKHPNDTDKTVVSAFVVLAVESDLLEKRKEYDKVPVLRNLVPAQVLSGNSSFNTGNSISAGLPVYARTRVKAIATLLENDRGSAALR